MSYYENSQWPTVTPQPQNNWEHQATTTPARPAASGPQPHDEYAFSYQFDEVDRAHENLQKSGKGYAMGGRPGRPPHAQGSRNHSVSNFDDSRGPPGPSLQSFYAAQRHHQPSRGSTDAEQVMQAKRRMAAQRERELRNLHTEQQYQRTVLADAPHNSNGNHNTINNNNNSINSSSSNNNNNNNSNAKHMSEEETRELIARQRSALYGEGPFADKTSYVDESGNIRKGAPGPSTTSSLRGASPLVFDSIGRPPAVDLGTPTSIKDHGSGQGELSPRPNSTTSPQSAGPNNKIFDNAVGLQTRAGTSSPTGVSPHRDLAPGSKPGQQGATVAPIGTRPTGMAAVGSQAKRSATPLTTSTGWGRGNGVWGQNSSGLGAQASVWG